jgi:hypothetical protein
VTLPLKTDSASAWFNSAVTENNDEHETTEISLHSGIQS